MIAQGLRHVDDFIDLYAQAQDYDRNRAELRFVRQL